MERVQVRVQLGSEGDYGRAGGSECGCDEVVNHAAGVDAEDDVVYGIESEQTDRPTMRCERRQLYCGRYGGRVDDVDGLCGVRVVEVHFWQVAPTHSHHRLPPAAVHPHTGGWHEAQLDTVHHIEVEHVVEAQMLVAADRDSIVAGCIDGESNEWGGVGTVLSYELYATTYLLPPLHHAVAAGCEQEGGRCEDEVGEVVAVHVRALVHGCSGQTAEVQHVLLLLLLLCCCALAGGGGGGSGGRGGGGGGGLLYLPLCQNGSSERQRFLLRLLSWFALLGLLAAVSRCIGLRWRRSCRSIVVLVLAVGVIGRAGLRWQWRLWQCSGWCGA